jgi:hypothetical protein
MFDTLETGLMLNLNLGFIPTLAAGLAQALGAAAGIIQGIGLVSVFGGLIGAAVSAIRPESPNLARGQGGGNEPPCKTKRKKKLVPGQRCGRPAGVGATAGIEEGHVPTWELDFRRVNLACTVWLKRRGLDTGVSSAFISNWD